MSRHDENDAGFTIIEVLVALTILSIGLAVLLSAFSTSLSRASTSESETTALGFAQSLLADAGPELPLRNGEQTGIVADRFRWRLEIEPYGNDADRDAWPVRAKRLTAVVSWMDRGTERSVMLTTLRLAPKSTAP